MRTLSSVLVHTSLSKVFEGGRKLINEAAEINSEKELDAYAEKFLKKAHGDKYNVKKKDEMVKSIISKNTKDGTTDWGACVGILQQSVSEGTVSSKKELYDYAEAILSKAHGDNYDPKEMKKMVSDIVAKNTKDGTVDYGACVGTIQASIAEGVFESYYMVTEFDRSIEHGLKRLSKSKLDEVLMSYANGEPQENLKVTATFAAFIRLCGLADVVSKAAHLWVDSNIQTKMSNQAILYVKQIDDIIGRTYALASKIPSMTEIVVPMEVDFTIEDATSSKFTPFLRARPEWSELFKIVPTISKDFYLMDAKSMQVKLLMMTFIDRCEELSKVVEY